MNKGAANIDHIAWTCICAYGVRTCVHFGILYVQFDMRGDGGDVTNDVASMTKKWLHGWLVVFFQPDGNSDHEGCGDGVRSLCRCVWRKGRCEQDRDKKLG